MASSTSPHESSEPRRQNTAAWVGIAGGPLAWAALLQTNYVLSYVACEQRQSWMLHVATAVALVLVGVAAVAARRASPTQTEGRDESGDVHVQRQRFMALAGLALCAWFAIVILATGIPALVLHPCTP